MVFGTACVMQMGEPGTFAQAGAACQPGGTGCRSQCLRGARLFAADTTIQILYEDVMRACRPTNARNCGKNIRLGARAHGAMQSAKRKATETQPEGLRLYHQCLTRKTQDRRKGLMRWPTTARPP